MARRTDLTLQPATTPIVDGEVLAESIDDPSSDHPFEPSGFIPKLCKHCGHEQEVHQHDADEDVWSFDDEDFYNAIDLMETSYSILKGMLKVMQPGSPRRQSIQNHCDDLKQFLDEFPFVSEAEPKS